MNGYLTKIVGKGWNKKLYKRTAYTAELLTKFDIFLKALEIYLAI